jgi:gamma-glutamylcyclotransferase (GGCT)/AIG2-like uncharacterized protein YtfP
MVETKLYAAYGSNMNKAQMHQRCPGAVPVGKYMLKDAKLVFRRVADSVHEIGSKMPIAVWRINAVHEAALDRFEGVSSGFYVKQWVTLDTGEKALIYVMTRDGIAPPSKEYYATIKQGYADFGIKTKKLEQALAASWSNKNVTEHIEERDQRRERHVYLSPQYGGGALSHSKKPSNISNASSNKPERETLENTTRYSQNELPLVPRKPRRTTGKVTNLSDWLDDRKNGGGRY